MTAAPILKRGTHVLPHQAQVVRRDLHGETVSRHLGGEALAYRRTADELADCRAGKPGTGLPYEYVLHSPQSSALAWCAFYTRADLAAFLAAYALTIDSEPAPGERFTVHLPATADDWQALDGLEPARDVSGYTRVSLGRRIADALDGQAASGFLTWEVETSDRIRYAVTPGAAWADPKPPTLRMTPGETAEWLGIPISE